jgi:TonB family protein
LSYRLSGSRRLVAHLINLGGRDVAALRAASRLEVKVKEAADLSFPLGSIAGAWSELDACLSRLRNSWNVAEGESERLASGPQAVAPLASLVSDADYPRMALREGQSGATGFVLLVDETGAVNDCTLTETSGAAALDLRACAIFTERARFKPAVDREGRPAKGAIATRLRWVLVR